MNGHQEEVGHHRELPPVEEEEEEDSDVQEEYEDENSSHDVEHKLEEFAGFRPPLYIQRYDKVLHILSDRTFVNHVRKVVDFGCAECKFLHRLKPLPRVREIVGVDLDESLLTAPHTERNCEPVAYEYLERRKHCPLDITIMCGSIAVPDPRWSDDVDAVTAIEL
jgi:hypothetical protein